jgi:hypothetical protein
MKEKVEFARRRGRATQKRTLARVRASDKPENEGNVGNYISKFYGKAGTLKGGFRRVQGGLKIVSNKVLEGRNGRGYMVLARDCQS